MSADPEPTAADKDAAAKTTTTNGGTGALHHDRQERRRAPRVRAVLPIAFRLVRTGSSDVFAGHTRDFSEGGMSLKIARPLPVGAQFLIYLVPGLPDGEALSLVYRVTRCVRNGAKESDGYVAAATLVGRAAAVPQPAPQLTPREILRRLRLDDPPRK